MRKIKKSILKIINLCLFATDFIKYSVSKQKKVYWWSRVKEGNEELENFGDFLTEYILEKISGIHPIYINPKKKVSSFFNHYLMIGSIIRLGNKKSIIWGSGIISSTDNIIASKILAVRGPRTAKRLIELGYHENKVYGDPAIILPLVYDPVVDKQYKIGIVTHYVDYDEVNKLLIKNKMDLNIKHINLLTSSVEKTIDEINMCDKIISTSLHGIIVANVYNIPTVWWCFSDNLGGDGVKFMDYFESVNLFDIKPVETKNILDIIDAKDYFLPRKTTVKDLQIGLLKVYPFNLKSEIRNKCKL